MENATLASVAWDNMSSSSSEPSNISTQLAHIRDLVLKIIYVIVGSVGVVDNLFVLTVFFLCIKITDKVPQSRLTTLHNGNFTCEIPFRIYKYSCVSCIHLRACTLLCMRPMSFKRKFRNEQDMLQAYYCMKFNRPLPWA